MASTTSSPSDAAVLATTRPESSQRGQVLMRRRYVISRPSRAQAANAPRCPSGRNQCHLAGTGEAPIVLNRRLRRLTSIQGSPVDSSLSRRELLRQAAAAAAALAFPAPALACGARPPRDGRGTTDTDQERLLSWT